MDLLRGTVDIAEVLTEVEGRLQVGPPKTKAGRRTVSLPRSIVEELAGRDRRPRAGRLRLDVPRWRAVTSHELAAADLAARHRGCWPRAAYATRPAPYRREPVDRAGCEPERGRTTRWTYVSGLHSRPVRAPVPGVRRRARRRARRSAPVRPYRSSRGGSRRPVRPLMRDGCGTGAGRFEGS